MSMARHAGNKVVIARVAKQSREWYLGSTVGQFLYNLDRDWFAKKLSRILEGTTSRKDLTEPAFLPAILVIINFISKKKFFLIIARFSSGDQSQSLEVSV
jgi:hypothetical protein